MFKIGKVDVDPALVPDHLIAKRGLALAASDQDTLAQVENEILVEIFRHLAIKSARGGRTSDPSVIGRPFRRKPSDFSEACAPRR